jgi:hypothetical protein
MKPTRPEQLVQDVHETKEMKRLLRTYRNHRLEKIVGSARALVSFKSDPENKDGYLLYEGHQLISRWREPNAPGLAAWLLPRMEERRAALHLARLLGALNHAQSAAGRDTVQKRETAKRKYVLDYARKAVARGEDPRTFAREWAEEFGKGRSTIYRWINRGIDPKKK